MDVGDFLDLQLLEHEAAGELCLIVVLGNGAEEHGVHATSGKAGGGGGGRHGYDVGIIVQGQGSLCRAGTDVAHDHCHLVGNELCGHIGGKFGLALIVADDKLDLFAENTALGVGLCHHDLGGIEAGHAVGGKVTGVGTGDADFDGVCGMERSRKAEAQKGRCHGTEEDAFHDIPPSRKLLTTFAD